MQRKSLRTALAQQPGFPQAPTLLGRTERAHAVEVQAHAERALASKTANRGSGKVRGGITYGSACHCRWQAAEIVPGILRDSGAMTGIMCSITLPPLRGSVSTHHGCERC
jgi:hypothetical protein